MESVSTAAVPLADRPPGPVRVFCVGLGAMGLGIASVLAARPGFEIVGAVSHQGDVDLGILVGAGATGRVLAELPDDPPAADLCVIATDSTLAKILPSAEWALAHGMNVVSCAEELVHPWVADRQLADRLDRAAIAAGRTVLGTGVNPGFAMDVLPICLSAACVDVRALTVRRVNDLSPFGPSVLRTFGVGGSLEEFEAGRRDGRIVGHVGFRQSIELLSKAIGLAYDEIDETLEPIVAKQRRERGTVVVEPGQIAGCLHVAEARLRGTMVIRLEHPQQIDPEAEGVFTGDFIDIDGDPPLRLRIEPEIPGGDGTIALVVNTAAQVVAAAPGLTTMGQIGLPSGTAWGAASTADETAGHGGGAAVSERGAVATTSMPTGADR